MGTKEKKKGISLIVLVITIIVIIILALAVILSINKNNPIENASKARFQNDIKTIQEEVTLHMGKQYTDLRGEYDPSKDGELQKIIDQYDKYKDILIVKDGKVKLTEKATEEETLWAKEIQVPVTIKPTIPVGFKYKEGTVEEGYVIVNELDGNEFVWIPVDVPEGKTFEEVFKRTEWSNNAPTNSISSSYTEPYNYNGATPNAEEKAEYEAMYDSVKRYSGFYIGRYEASQNESGLAQSKKGEIPWSGIGWSNVKNMQTQAGGAVEKARAVYQNSSQTEGSKYAVSTLVYGVQWDAALKYLSDKYDVSNSTTWGNHFNAIFEYLKDGVTKTKNKYLSMKIPTGSSEYCKAKNIYDLAGNLYEWTMEASSSSNRVYRGGNSYNVGNTYPVSYRNSAYSNDSFVDLGFRLALYIK